MEGIFLPKFTKFPEKKKNYLHYLHSLLKQLLINILANV